MSKSILDINDTLPEPSFTIKSDSSKKQKKYYILEWCGLDDNIELFEIESDKEIAAIYEEFDNELSCYEQVLVMDKERFGNFLNAVKKFEAESVLKGIDEKGQV